MSSDALSSVYYKVFSGDGALEPRNVFDESYPHTGRVDASLITPPQTAKNIKRYLCREENITDAEHAELWATLTSDELLGDQDRLPVLASDGPGSGPDDPVALIIDPHSANVRTSNMVPPQPVGALTPVRPFSPNFSSEALRLVGPNTSVFCVAFSPDSTKIVSSSGDETIRVWDIALSRVVTHIATPNALVVSVAFSPDGKWIASSASSLPYIRLWDARTGAQVPHLFEGHTNPVHCVAFSPDGRHIVSGSRDKTIRIWDVQRGHGRILVHPTDSDGHTDSTSAVAFSPDGKRIVSGSRDTTVRVWDVRNGGLVAGPYRGHSDLGSPVAFSPDGQCVAGAADYDIRVWDTTYGMGVTLIIITKRLIGHWARVNSVAFSPDGRWIISGAHDSTVRIWDIENCEMVTTLYTYNDEVTNASVVMSSAISPDGEHIVASTQGGVIYVWSRK